MKDLESLDAAFVIDTFLLLLIGIGPKIALVPFLEATAAMPEAVKRRVLRKMLTTAAVVAALLLVLGGLLTRLLHFSPGALGVASGIILLCGQMISRFVSSLRSPLLSDIPSLIGPRDVVGGLVLIGAFVGLVGSWLSMRRFLKQT